jgi:hypothetical protein
VLVFLVVALQVLQNDIDLLNPPAELEKLKHKKKRLVQSPNSFFMVRSHTPSGNLLALVFILKRAFLFLVENTDSVLRSTCTRRCLCRMCRCFKPLRLLKIIIYVVLGLCYWLRLEILIQMFFMQREICGKAKDGNLPLALDAIC